MKIDAIEGKIIRLAINDLNNQIKVESFSVTDLEKEINIGAIFEKYRNIKRDRLEEANRYWENHLNTLEEFINNIEIESEINPDLIQVISTSDINRKDIIKKFAFKIKNELASEAPIISDNFSKIDSDLSIKEMSGNIQEKSQYFNYKNPTNIKFPMDNLVIIDDIINDGDTFQVLLNKMMEAKIIDKNTVVQFFIIYNNRKFGDNNKANWRELFE